MIGSPEGRVKVGRKQHFVFSDDAGPCDRTSHSRRRQSTLLLQFTE